MKKRLFLIIGLFMILLPISVFARVYDVDMDVTLNKNYNASHFSVGGNIKQTENSNIDGINVMIGEKINAEGSSAYGLFIGQDIYLSEKLDKDLFLLGDDINISNDSVLPRDVYIMGNDIKINSDIGGNLRLGASKIDLSGVKVNGNVTLYADNIVFDKDTVISGTLKYVDNAKVEGLDLASIETVKTIAAKEIKETTIKDKVNYFASSFIMNYITMLVFILVFKKFREKLEKKDYKKLDYGKRLGQGAIILFLVPLASIFAIFTVVLMPVSLITLALYMIAVYVSTYIVSYKVGDVVSEYTKVKNPYLNGLIGLLIYKVLSIIPFIGSFISLFAILIGLGIIYSYIKTSEI